MDDIIKEYMEDVKEGEHKSFDRIIIPKNQFIIGEIDDLSNVSLSILDSYRYKKVSNINENVLKHLSTIVDWSDLVHGESSFVSTYLIEFIKATSYKNIHYVIDNIFEMMFKKGMEMRFVCLSATFYYGTLCLTNGELYYYLKRQDRKFTDHLVILKTNLEFSKTMSSAINQFKGDIMANDIEDFDFSIFKQKLK